MEAILSFHMECSDRLVDKLLPEYIHVAVGHLGEVSRDANTAFRAIIG
jgi:hypothetical protein